MLEEKIEELTAAVKELTAVMSAGAAPKKTRKTKKSEEVKEDPEAKAEEDCDSRNISDSEEVKGEPEPEEEPNFPATLGDVKKAIIAVAKIENGRDIAIAVLEEFGAKKATELKQEDYFMVVKTLNEGLNGGGKDD